MTSPIVGIQLTRSWKWFLAVGIITLLTGFAALTVPMVAGITLTALIGSLFIISGFFQAMHTFRIHQWKSKLWYVLSSALYIIGGLLLLFKPVAGLFTITGLMVFIIMVNGATRIIFALSNRNVGGWPWIAVSGVLSFAIGWYFFGMLDDPEFSLTLLGTFIGVSLLFEGISFIFMGSQLKKMAKEI